MKTCTKCEASKDESEFNWKEKGKGRRQPVCRVCQNKINRDHYKRNPAPYLSRKDKQREELTLQVIRYLSSHPCVDCGESNIVVLEFDHQENKEYSISRMIKLGFTWKHILHEIEKCEVRCANCHRKRTAKIFGWLRIEHI